MAFDATLTGGRLVGARIATLPARLRKRVVETFEEFNARLLGLVEALEPDRTGTLRHDTRSFLHEGERVIEGGIHVFASPKQAAKDAALEYGAHAGIQVREHTRSLDHVFAVAIPPMEVIVDPYTRTPNIAEHEFLRGPFETMRPEILAALDEALLETVEDDS